MIYFDFVINILSIPNDVFQCNGNTCPLYCIKRRAARLSVTNYYFVPFYLSLRPLV